MSNWISVKDRLPEQNEPTRFLLLRSDGEISINYWMYYTQTIEELKTGNETKVSEFDLPCPVCDPSGSMDEVTHWMPLPEKPK